MKKIKWQTSQKGLLEAAEMLRFLSTPECIAPMKADLQKCSPPSGFEQKNKNTREKTPYFQKQKTKKKNTTQFQQEKNFF